MNLLVNTSQMSQLLLLVGFHCELLFASSFKRVGVHVLCFSRIVCGWNVHGLQRASMLVYQ